MWRRKNNPAGHSLGGGQSTSALSLEFPSLHLPLSAQSSTYEYQSKRTQEWGIQHTLLLERCQMILKVPFLVSVDSISRYSAITILAQG